MKFTVGYQADEKCLFTDEIIKSREHISEVYFAYGNFPNGRHSAERSFFLTPEQARERQLSDLERISGAGIALNLLLNANCYGERSLERSFYEEIGYTVDYLDGLFGLSSLTTTSPIIAKFIKSNFEKIKVRASVNMDINGAKSMDFIKDYFDSFYLRREYNRNFDEIVRARKWCDDNGKGLYMLANSGCLSFCPLHNFHDNLVAHEEEIAKRDNAFEFHSICRERMSGKEYMHSLICDTSFVRPEDIYLYEGFFDGAKLATRVNPRPVQVLRAYLGRSFSGNLAELLEPDHSKELYPYALENSKLPKDFGEKLLHCGGDCDACGYCKAAFDDALIDMSDFVY